MDWSMKLCLFYKKTTTFYLFLGQQGLQGIKGSFGDQGLPGAPGAYLTILSVNSAIVWEVKWKHIQPIQTENTFISTGAIGLRGLPGKIGPVGAPGNIFIKIN